VFRYFEVFEQLGEPPLFEALVRVQRWRAGLAGRASVRDAVAADYPQRLTAFLRGKGSALSRRLQAAMPPD
jgi:glutathione S-transferase